VKYLLSQVYPRAQGRLAHYASLAFAVTGWNLQIKSESRELNGFNDFTNSLIAESTNQQNAMLSAPCSDLREILYDVLPSATIMPCRCNGLLFLLLDKGAIMLKVFPGFSFDQHQISGQQIYNARKFFGELHLHLAESYGESARPVQLAENIIETIDRLRNSLAEIVCTENPDRQDWELDRCYFSVGD
jgi:hypothetical protein